MYGTSKYCKVAVRKLVVESGVVTARVSVYGKRNDGLHPRGKSSPPM
jgi:hypothetical protein